MANTDYYLKIDGIEGESDDAKQKGSLQISNWSFGESNAGSSALGGGAGAGKVSMQDFHFNIAYGKHSTKLFEACATGAMSKTAVLTCRKAGGNQEDFLKITFTDVHISSYNTGGPGPDGPLPTDSCSFNFTKIEQEYKEQKPDGTLGGTFKGGFDVKKNTKV